ncbi:MAG TPA: response regulator transcription factor [Stellaceae bacterium]|nr:response regulator transcription factor [Stellaceae bacterium]
MTARILIVDDDDSIRGLLKEYLERSGFRAVTAADGRAMKEELRRSSIDLIVLDLMLPGEDGYSLCRWIRAQRDIPIIMLTAKGRSEERVRGLELGADDYVTKPFDPRELLARVRGVLRRSGGGDRRTGTPRGFSFGGWELNLPRRQLFSPEGVLVPLAASEFQLLVIFLENARTVLTRDQLIERCHGREAGPFDRSIDVRVSQLRQRLGDSGREPRLIKTIRSAGYALAADVVRHG